MPEASDTIRLLLASTISVGEWEVELPLDIPAERLIAKILALDEFSLPERDATGRFIPYRLLWQEGDRHLGKTETLRQANLQPNQTLVLTREAPAAGGRVFVNPVFAQRGFSTERDLCAVMMPFELSMRPIYEDHIKRPLEKRLGLRCVRVDDLYDIKPIIETIWSLLNRARIVVADLTGRNANVFYEIGVAHTLGKDVVLLAQSIEYVPFDLRHLPCLVYEYTPRGATMLEDRLVATVSAITR